MNGERSPVTHSASIESSNFWRRMDSERKKEYLHIDTLYNRQFLEQSRAVLFGVCTGLGLSLLLMRIKNRVVLASVTSGLSCMLFCQLRSAPVHSQYFKVWDAVKNDSAAIEAIRNGSDSMTSDDFAYFYHKYLRFAYPELASSAERKLEHANN